MIVLNNHYLVNGFKQPIFLKFSHLKNNTLAIVVREHTAVGVTQRLRLRPQNTSGTSVVHQRKAVAGTDNSPKQFTSATVFGLPNCCSESWFSTHCVLLTRHPGLVASMLHCMKTQSLAKGPG